MKKIGIYILFCFIITLSCKDDSVSNESDNYRNEISGLLSIAECRATRGTPINSATDENFKDFRLYARESAGTVTGFADAGAYFIDGEVITGKNGQWSISPIRYWPQDNLNFAAYAPASPQGVTVAMDADDVPVLTYTVPSNVTEQPDLMIAVNELNLNHVTVPVTFRHTLSCIAFEVSGPDLPVDSIAIKGVSTSGTISLIINGTDDKIAWENLSPSTDKLFKVGLISNPIAGNDPSLVTAADGYLMMIPQTLDDTDSILIWFSDMSVKSVPLKNSQLGEWEAGYQYTYTLREGTYDFEVTVDNTQQPYSGGTYNLKINSYYKSQSGTEQSLGWKTEIISSTGRTDWISGLDTLPDNTGGADIPKLLSCIASYSKSTSAIDNGLRSTDSIKFANMKDLSFNGSTYTTANTYAVNGPGWYKFPCFVMGNGINSATSLTINNTTCFPTSGNFLNYEGTYITGLEQLSLNTSGATAVILWEDAPGLITEVALTDNNNYIRFNVPQQRIRQGNGIIAIKDNSGNIMWSWQIWVTDWKAGWDDQLFNDEGVYYKIMKYPIGYCNAAEYYYPENEITIRFTQNASGKTQIVTLKQAGDTISYGDNITYYQWGRKDPVIGLKGIDNLTDNKPQFGPEPYSFFATGPVSLDYAITHPYEFVGSGSTSTTRNWNAVSYATLWNTVAGGSTISKSIYDPCPAGYMVADYNEDLTGLQYTYTAGSANDGIPLTCSFTSDTGTKVLFNAMGDRENTKGAIVYLYTNGVYWTNTLYSGTISINLLFGIGIDPYGQTNGTGLAAPVIAINE